MYKRQGGAHKGDLLAGLGVQADVVQHQLLRGIAEVHVIQHYFALQTGVGDGAFRLVGMFPGPHVGALFALHQVAVLVLLGVYQGDRKSTRLNSSHSGESRMPYSA